ncbi:MAG: phenylalanine--tRNA ligase beta subunit-related protein [Clostridia bacterium]|nr:phenylalanine--tRNA ligase beta subunit-related protein [Clostridia bacterium]
MNFIVEDKVKDLGVKILGLKIEGIDNNLSDSEFDIWRENKINELINKYKEYDLKSDKVIEGFYELHQKVGVPRRKNLPASENLIKLLIKREDLVHINKAVDIYNIISIDSKLCLGAHDIDKVSGNVTLKICNGTENFIPLGSEEAKTINNGEYSFVDDSNDVICWLDIRQVDKTKVTEESKNILYLIIGNQENSYQELENVANEISDITTKYCGGKVTILKE